MSVLLCAISGFSGSLSFAQKVGSFSRNGAKAQSAAAFLAVFFAPLRRCGRNVFARYTEIAQRRALVTQSDLSATSGSTFVARRAGI